MADSIGTLVILGAGGDLAKRLLLPGLGQLLDTDRGKDLRLIGVGFDPMTDDEWRDRVKDSSPAVLPAIAPDRLRRPHGTFRPT
jgi:glucose-6-phosphate 1-dehydrogenase